MGSRAMSSKELGLDEIREFIEKEIEELEERLQVLRSLLALLEECSAAAAVGQLGGQSQDFHSPDGRLVARMTTRRDTVTLMFFVPVPENHPYIRYVTRALAKIQEGSEGLEYTVDKEGRYVKKITVMGVNRDNVDDVKAVLEYAAMKISHLSRSR